MKVIKRKIADLIAAEYNPRELTPDQFKQLKDSLTRFGVVDPVIVNTHPERKDIIVGGHQRTKVWEEMGNKEIPTVEVNLTPEKERELNIRLNKNSGQWDEQALQEHFNTDELVEWGFDGEELKFFEQSETTEGLIEDDEIPEVTEAITKEGDLWLLGEHRLLCGDSTKQEDVERLMDGNKADMVFTDPPYGVTDEKWDRIFNQQDLDMLFYITNGSILVWNATKPEIFKHMLNLEPLCDRIAVWRMTSSITGKGGMFWTWQPIYCWRSKDIKLWDSMEFESDQPTRTGEHPTQKPIGLIMKWIKGNNSAQSIADPFLGSGSTLIACEKTNRKCYGMELDPHYCDVIVKRWEEYTGKKAERLELVTK